MAIDFIELITSMIKPLVMNPDVVVVKKLSESSDNISVQVIVHSDDLGRVIGKGGKIVSAIRTILYAGAAKENVRISLDVDSF